MPAQVRIIFNDLPKIEGLLRSNAGRIVADTARAIARSAQAAVHVDSGALRDSIQASQVAPFNWQVTTGSMREAFYQEYGGRGGPHPFMVPSAHQEEPRFVERMNGLITE